MLNPESDGRSSGHPNGGHGLWKADSVEGLSYRHHNNGCTKGQTLMILSIMSVYEERGHGVLVVIKGF